MTAKIGICLATYNGARFLDDQLASIAGQTYPDWHLYARDDGADDGTAERLADFARRHPGRVTVIRDGFGRLGPCGNFARVMEQVEEPYIAYSDQDDIWRPVKLARALARLRALEAGQVRDTPAMVHADRRLINTQGAKITPSYWRSRGVRPGDFDRLEAHYAFCLAAGSTMLINRPLLALANPVPAAARMHDCWIELLAHAFGAVDAMDEIALDHRRHRANASGPGDDNDSPGARRLVARLRRLWRALPAQRAVYAQYVAQAVALHQRHGTAMSPPTARRLELFQSIPGRWFPGRVLALLRARAAPPGLARALVFAAFSGQGDGPERDRAEDKILHNVD